jgi:hypothetical protein
MTTMPRRQGESPLIFGDKSALVFIQAPGHDLFPQSRSHGRPGHPQLRQERAGVDLRNLCFVQKFSDNFYPIFWDEIAFPCSPKFDSL